LESRCLHSSRQNNHRWPARLSVSRALPNARGPGPPPRAYRDAGTPHGSAAIRFVDYMLGLAAVLILHCRLTGAIRFIHHAAPGGDSSADPSPRPTSDPARLESPAGARRACPLE
jgi:hypothetical protein